MTLKQFNRMVDGLYTSYVNIVRKMEVQPISKREFASRMRFWEW